jgi:hypothetical protein
VLVCSYQMISQNMQAPRTSAHGNISLQHHGLLGDELLSSEQVTLTWPRPLSRKAHETLFYIVLNEIEADALFGYIDPARGSSGIACHSLEANGSSGKHHS